ncbi:MAG: hypothetical protein NW208_13115 [Bryobacter sp.]|nr:hypothetical protein [Bryobacter sp.]
MPPTSPLLDERAEALQHLHFQMSLLRLTALPAEGKGPSVESLRPRQEASTADLELEQLSLAATRLEPSPHGSAA